MEVPCFQKLKMFRGKVEMQRLTGLLQPSQPPKTKNIWKHLAVSTRLLRLQTKRVMTSALTVTSSTTKQSKHFQICSIFYKTSWVTD